MTSNRLSGSELMDDSVVTYSLLPFPLRVIDSKPRELGRLAGFCGVFCGFCGARSTGWRTGGPSRAPVESKWRRYGPNSSPTQNVPSFIRAMDSTSKSAPVSSLRVLIDGSTRIGVDG